MFSHWSRPKPNASEGGWVIYSDLQEILLITPGVLENENQYKLKKAQLKTENHDKLKKEQLRKIRTKIKRKQLRKGYQEK